MAELPETLDVGPHVYAVRQQKRVGDGSADLDGEISFVKMTISILRQNCASKKREVLLHEVMHGICRNADLDREWGQEKLENYVFRITPLLLDVLRRNPQLIAFLVEP